MGVIFNGVSVSTYKELALAPSLIKECHASHSTLKMKSN
jgi:hypothetical protein